VPAGRAKTEGKIDGDGSTECGEFFPSYETLASQALLEVALKDVLLL